jgi:RNAse H-fold protein YqgF
MITINEFKNKLSSGSRLLGIDLGIKRIGIAISDYNQKIATPLQTLDKSKQVKLIDELESIITEYDIKGIIIGNPINMDGTYGKSSQSAKDIAINISDKIDIPVSLWDERLSTVGAFNLSSELDINVSKREKDIDKFAAAFILQGALDFIQN